MNAFWSIGSAGFPFRFTALSLVVVSTVSTVSTFCGIVWSTSCLLYTDLWLIDLVSVWYDVPTLSNNRLCPLKIHPLAFVPPMFTRWVIIFAEASEGRQNRLQLQMGKSIGLCALLQDFWAMLTVNSGTVMPTQDARASAIQYLHLPWDLQSRGSDGTRQHRAITISEIPSI